MLELESTPVFVYSTTPSACFTSCVTVVFDGADSGCSSAAMVKSMISCVAFVVVVAMRYGQF
ncbi:hypothetical protein BJ165DRAFT_1482929 [Panaeolus papilionaceus]|nr:hypothetical protein BJ165DRAFT_1482929 [Panaeolus papilionaceus]